MLKKTTASGVEARRRRPHVGRWLAGISSVLLLLQMSVLNLPQVQAVGENGYADFSYRYSGVNAPSGEKPQSKLWFADNRWWGSLFNISTGKYHIHWLNSATQKWIDTGTVLDDRPSAKADCLWDA